MVGRQLIAAALALALGACRDPDRVDARDHHAFWLWAGVQPQPALEHARILYILDGEVREGERRPFVPLLAQPPRLRGPQLWLVVRTDTLRWTDDSLAIAVAHLDRWSRANPGLRGIQVDFDARTRHLDDYADFLAALRRRLPARYGLSITGLMDWSANGDPRVLGSLRGTVDEVVVQTYQGRETIPGYEKWFDRMKGFPMPFRVGLVQGGRWREPATLRNNPNFQGYVVFLLRQPG